METPERICIGCGTGEETLRLEMCGVCRRFFCADCVYRAAFGRKFCSPECARAYYFSGEESDDDDLEPDE